MAGLAGAEAELGENQVRISADAAVVGLEITHEADQRITLLQQVQKARVGVERLVSYGRDTADAHRPAIDRRVEAPGLWVRWRRSADGGVRRCLRNGAARRDGDADGDGGCQSEGEGRLGHRTGPSAGKVGPGGEFSLRDRVRESPLTRIHLWNLLALECGYAIQRSCSLAADGVTIPIACLHHSIARPRWPVPESDDSVEVELAAHDRSLAAAGGFAKSLERGMGHAVTAPHQGLLGAKPGRLDGQHGETRPLAQLR